MRMPCRLMCKCLKRMVRHQKIGRTSFVTFSSCITGLFAGYYGKSRKELQYAEGTNQAGWTECEGA